MATTEPLSLEPRGVFALVGSAIRETLSHGASALITVAVIMLPVALLQLVLAFATAELGILDMQKQMQSGQMPAGGMDWRPFIISGALQLLYIVISMIAMYFAAASVARLLATRAVGRHIGAEGAWDASLGMFGRLVGGGFVQLLIYGAAVMVLALPLGIVSAVLARTMGPAGAAGSQRVIQVIASVIMGIPLLILASYLVPMPAASAIEGKGGFAALGRGFALVAGNLGRVLGPLFIVAVALGAPIGLASWAMNAYALAPLRERMDSLGAVVASAPSSVLLLLLVPFAYTLQTLIYFDLRSRKQREGLTPKQLAIELGEPSSPEPPDGYLPPAPPS